MADDRIEIEIVLDDGSIQKGFAKIRQEGKKTEKSLAQNFKSALRADISKPFDIAKRSVFNLRNAVVGLTAALGAGAFLRTVTQAAAEQETAVNALNVSLKTAGEFSQEASESFQALASELQAQSRFGDEVILQQAALARNYARNNEEAEKLIKTSIDLAEATGISLDSAVRNLGKTLSGLTGELGEAVPQVRGLTAEQLKAGAAIDVLAERFGGAAQGAIRTFAGATAQLSNTFGDLLEVVGETITKSPQVIAFINALSQTFNGLIKNLAGSGQGFDAFFKNLVINGAAAANALIDSFSVIAQIPSFVQFSIVQFSIGFDKFRAILTDGIRVVIGAFTKMAEVYANVLNAIGLGGTTIGRAINKISELRTMALDSLNETSEQFRENAKESEQQLLRIAQGGNEVDKSFDLARQTLDDFTTTFQELSTTPGPGPAIAQGVQSTVEAVDPALRRLRESVAKTQEDISNSVKDNIFNLVAANRELFIDTKELTRDELEALKANLEEFSATTLQTANTLSNAFKNGFARVISSSVQTLVTGLAKGSLSFKDFGKQILGLLGDIAIQIGTTVVAGSKALTALFSGNPAAGIGFGLALIAVGSLLKAGATGGIAGAAGVPSGQDAITSPILDDGVSDNLEDQSARVNVTIEGNVFDGDETGLRIADILKDQGFNNAVVS